jgi:Protein of unknown function (DUF5818)
MKKTARLCVGLGILGGAVWISSPTFGGPDQTFKGEIADSQCALGVHSLTQSHKEMIGMTPSLKTDAECVRYCVKERGGRFVLQVKEKVYRLDRQDLAEQNVGAKVKVVGKLDAKTDTITVRTLEAIPEDSKNTVHPK